MSFPRAVGWQVCARARGSTRAWGCWTGYGDQPQGAGPGGVRAGGEDADRPPRRACAACRISRARVVHAGRIITAGGITSGIEPGFHLLRRAGYDQAFLADI